MKIKINRTGNRVCLLRNDETIYSRAAFEILESYGYRRIPVLDIENYDFIEWNGIEYNRLLEKDGVIYKFVEWAGEYPFDGITIEEIGYLERE
jgi:hypothetical protein